MKEKGWMIEYFHERTYRPQDLQRFEKEVENAARLGAEYFFLSEIPKRKEEWTKTEGDPYPNWGMLQTSLFKLAVPKALEPWLDREYADQNRKLLAKRSKIIKKYGMKAALVLIDPFYLPEEAYLKNPDWRGPRCDHPRRSKRMYFSPCVDSPGVQQLYREALDTLYREVDLHYIQIITNDSGAGICWTEGLYSGKNGPAACRSVLPADRLAGFMELFSESAKELGHDILIDLTSDILGFKEPETSMEQAYGKLGKGQLLNGRNREGHKPIQLMPFPEYDHIRPLKGIAFPLALLKQLWDAQKTDAEYIKLVLPDSANGEYEAALAAWRERGGDEYQDFMEVCIRTASKVAGDRNRNMLMEAWAETEDALQRLKDIQYDDFVMMPLISQRLINRPLVPRPERLTEEETAYFETCLFQATTREQALDYMNIQGMEFVRGFTACRMMRLIAQDALGHLQKAADVYGLMRPGRQWSVRQTKQSVRCLKVLKCLIKTMIHAVGYQEILDRTDREETPERQTVWPVRGDARLLSMNEICREEIDNTYELYRLLTSAGEDFGASQPVLVEDLIATAEEEAGEDIFLVGKNLPQQLIKKAEIMLAHMRDAESTYESDNR